jgi:Zn-finger nucleic acid-binding protein
MNCPKCIAPMESVPFGGIDVERCTGCHGLFFDEFDKERLRRMKGADVLDTGDPKVGREFNVVDCIHCPRCTSGMIRMVDREQPHIWFEHCTVCGGSFFDAGEFKDLAHHTIVDFFKDLLVKERK